VRPQEARWQKERRVHGGVSVELGCDVTEVDGHHSFVDDYIRCASQSDVIRRARPFSVEKSSSGRHEFSTGSS
jgi:hypothetical protein